MATRKHIKLGENVVVAGLLIQVIMFGLFAATAVVFQVRLHKSPTREILPLGRALETEPVRALWSQLFHYDSFDFPCRGIFYGPGRVSVEP